MANGKFGTAATIVGITDDAAFGYMESLSIEAAVEDVEARSGNGDIKAVNHIAKKHNVSGTFVHITSTPLDDNDPRKQVGTGTAIEIADADSAHVDYVRTTIYITNVTEQRSSGDFFRVDFTGAMYEDLGA